MRRVIRIDYQFTFESRKYEGHGIPVGETIEKTISENETRMSAVSHGTFMDTEDFAQAYDYPWNWTDADWRKAGFDFEYCTEAR